MCGWSNSWRTESSFLTRSLLIRSRHTFLFYMIFTAQLTWAFKFRASCTQPKLPAPRSLVHLQSWKIFCTDQTPLNYEKLSTFASCITVPRVIVLTSFRPQGLFVMQVIREEPSEGSLSVLRALHTFIGFQKAHLSGKCFVSSSESTSFTSSYTRLSVTMI